MDTGEMIKVVIDDFSRFLKITINNESENWSGKIEVHTENGVHYLRVDNNCVAALPVNNTVIFFV